MNRFAKELVCDLRNSIRKLVKLVDEENNSRISLIDPSRPDFDVWLLSLSFMARKTCARYLGSTDYDYDLKDLKISFLNEGAANDKKNT